MQGLKSAAGDSERGSRLYFRQRVSFSAWERCAHLAYNSADNSRPLRRRFNDLRVMRIKTGQRDTARSDVGY